jgi:nitroreductase
MEFFDVLRSRHSIRAFSPDPVDSQQVAMILDAANAAPSAGNRQAYEIYLAESVARRAALAEAVPNMPFLNAAPLVLVFCASPERSVSRYGDRGRNLYSVQDATISCTYAMLAAAALGLGSVWVGAFREDPVRQALEIPLAFLPVAILPIGHPAEKPETRARRPVAELVHTVR